MKKALSFLLLMLMAPFIGFAQEDSQRDAQLFNHLALGVTAGIDGVGGAAAITVTPLLQLRGGFSVFPYKYTGTNMSFLPEKVTINDTERNLREGTTMTVALNTGGPHLLLDFFPGANTVFHLTAGAYFANPKFIDVDADLSRVLLASEYASAYIELQENNVDSRISSDQNGHVHAALVPATKSIRPYFGIGFGRPVNVNTRVSFTFDMGVIYLGHCQVQAYDYTLEDSGRPIAITSELLENQDSGIIDKYVTNIPVFPMMKFSLFVRLF